MMPLSFAMRVTVPADVLITAVDGESVLLNLENESYFGLDEVGTRMWTVLTTSTSIRSAYEALLGEYDVEPQKLRQDLETLIQQLQKHGLVEVSGG